MILYKEHKQMIIMEKMLCLLSSPLIMIWFKFYILILVIQKSRRIIIEKLILIKFGNEYIGRCFQ